MTGAAAGGKMMKAQFYQGARRFVPGTAPVPTAGPGEALLRVRRVGICGTDLHIYEGHLDARVGKGRVIGHETFAEVVEAPTGAAVRAGDRVVVNPVVSCGECRACKMGASYVCYNLKVRGVDVDGGMRELYPVPVDRLLKVPDALSDDHAALIEPLAVATHDVNRAQVKPGDSVLVFGGGPIGALIAMVCRHRGARVAVAEINPFRVEMLRGLGLEVVGPDRDVMKFVPEWTNGEGVDVAFEVTGNPKAVRLMTDVVRVWGTISIVAIHSEPMPVNLLAMFSRELNMHASRLYTWEAWEEAIRLGATGAVTLGPLVSKKIPLEALGEGMEQALKGGPVMKVLIDLTQ
ncbi:MAG TPA: alcohol dehydrogenase catalytic domain-containing protein [Methylomirabilota bacterium]|nr:alcohol dehydrogenase catalytic domain-containing protein [Methylomirabilota bacterium]